MTDPTWLIHFMEVKFYDLNHEFVSSEWEARESWEYKEDLHLGRCYTFKPKIQALIKSIEIAFFAYNMKVFIHAKGNYLSPDRLEIEVEERWPEKGRKIEVDLDYEIIEGLDIDEMDCTTSDIERDTCMDTFIHQVIFQFQIQTFLKKSYTFGNSEVDSRNWMYHSIY